MKVASILAVASAVALLPASAAIVITEVYPGGSGNGSYAADWFELTNTGVATVDITGWRFDDSSNAFASAVAFRGVTSLAPGQSVVFAESNAAGTNDPTVQTNFVSAWFGGTAPQGFTIGFYGGSGIGLSTGGDAVNIFDSLGGAVTGVTFGATTEGFTFDNAAGASGAISLLSSVGANGAFTSANGAEVGSPGVVPEPATVALLGLGAAFALLIARRRRRE